MSTRRICGMLLVLALMAGPALAANIIWVDEGAGGFAEWQALLEGAGHTVTNMTGMNELDQAKIDAMNASDLVIVSRDTNSGGYDDGDEPTQWNSLTVPLIQTSVYLIRSNRWLWVDGTGTPTVDTPDQLVITEAHPIFKGVGAVGDEIEILAASGNISDVSDGGNGQVLATHTDGRLWITLWEPDVEFYSGAGQIPAAQRMWFCAAGNEDSGLKGSMNLTEVGQKLFLNAIAFLTGGLNAEIASNPIPAVESVDIPRDTILSWTPGEFAVTHDVYLGTVLDDVNTADRTNAKGVLVSEGQDANTYAPAAVLEYGQTYYWRIDEVNGAPDNTIFPGELWSFTVEPFAYEIEGVTVTSNAVSDPPSGPERTIDGSGLNAMDQHSVDSADMWLGAGNGVDPIQLEYTFDGVYKLHEMLVWNYNVAFEPVLGFGLKGVTVEYTADGVEWTVLGDVELAQATATPDYVANSAVDFGGVAAQAVRITVNSNYGGLPQFGLSEVRFLQIPATAREPQPASDAADVGVNPTLSWRAGRGAATHDVSFGADPDALDVVDSVSDAVFMPGALDYGMTYYWKVDEVNEAEAISVWEGDVWSFATQEYAVVEDFESYTDDEGNRIYEFWIDGFGVADNGSQVGHLEAPFAETTIVRSGNQAMPLFYENTGTTISEAELTLSENWTTNGIKSLSLYFQGAAGNSGQLYVKIDGTRVDYDGDAGDIGKTAWQPWNIDLSTVGNVSNVKSLIIGIEGAGATGVVYVDDIRLYPREPEFIVPVEPDDANLLAFYDFEGNANDSSGNGLHGAIVDGQIVSPGRQGQGTAVQLAAAGYVDLGNPPLLDFGTGDWTISAWFKTAMVGTGDANKGTLVGKGGDSGGGHRYALILSETNEGVVTLVTDDNVTKHVVNATSVVNDDEWHFALGQRVGTSLQIFVDGLLEGTGAPAADYDLSGTSQHNAYVGAITNNGDGSLYKLFNGLIDDVRIDARAMSEGEVLWLAGQTAPKHKPF